MDTLQSAGMGVDADQYAAHVLKCIRDRCCDIVLSGWDFDDNVSALELLVAVKRLMPNMPVLVLSPFPDIAYAARAVEFGAFDYVEVPFARERLLEAVNAALRGRQIHDPMFERICSKFVAATQKSMQIVHEIAKYARESDCDVLVAGETGTGKEVCANLIHQESNRNKKPFLAENCASIPANLEESELFGHEKGAFTGADRRHLGAFEMTNGGTLLLDEIEELSADVQAKLLRVVETRTFRRVGGEQNIRFCGRIIYASNSDLAEEVEKGEFRPDLYHRIGTHQISIPPLRERPGDVVALADHFLKLHGKGRLVTVSTPVAVLLNEYPYPGNVRELEGIIKYALLQCDGDQIMVRHLPLYRMVHTRTQKRGKGLVRQDLYSLLHKEAITSLERDYNREFLPWILNSCGNNLTRAAMKAGLGTKTFRRKWKECGLGPLSTR